MLAGQRGLAKVGQYRLYVGLQSDAESGESLQPMALTLAKAAAAKLR